VITLLQLDGARVTDLERALQIHDTVFRHLLVRGDETVPVAEEGAEPESGDGLPVAEAGLPGSEDDVADDAADDVADDAAGDAADDAAHDVADDAADEDDNAPPAEIAEGDEE
jgi:hypothetical protein